MRSRWVGLLQKKKEVSPGRWWNVDAVQGVEMIRLPLQMWETGHLAHAVQKTLVPCVPPKKSGTRTFKTKRAVLLFLKVATSKMTYDRLLFGVFRQLVSCFFFPFFHSTIMWLWAPLWPLDNCDLYWTFEPIFPSSIGDYGRHMLRRFHSNRHTWFTRHFFDRTFSCLSTVKWAN